MTGQAVALVFICLLGSVIGLVQASELWPVHTDEEWRRKRQDEFYRKWKRAHRIFQEHRADCEQCKGSIYAPPDGFWLCWRFEQEQRRA